MSNPFVSSDLSFAVPSTGSGNIGIKDATSNGPEIRLYQSFQYHFHVPS